jgi:hypothetical protein
MSKFWFSLLLYFCQMWLSVSGRFWSLSAHAVCFCTLVAILDFSLFLTFWLILFPWEEWKKVHSSYILTNRSMAVLRLFSPPVLWNLESFILYHFKHTKIYPLLMLNTISLQFLEILRRFLQILVFLKIIILFHHVFYIYYVHILIDVYWNILNVIFHFVGI